MAKVWLTEDYNNAASCNELTREYIRFLFYGGAKEKDDNSSFYFASLNVLRDYKNDGKIIREYLQSGQQVINRVNEQADDSIQSIDFFSHGDMFGLYIIEGSSIYADIADEEVEAKNLNASLYLGELTRQIRGSDVSRKSAKIHQLNFKKFTEGCKIEIHGCLTAANMYLKDTICEELSELLYRAGKKRAVVIGHTERANPNINNKKYDDKNYTDEEQDYRHGTRRMFHNGNMILEYKQKGRITGAIIHAALQEN